jgi:hypothetical protein
MPLIVILMPFVQEGGKIGDVRRESQNKVREVNGKKGDYAAFPAITREAFPSA